MAGMKKNPRRPLRSLLLVLVVSSCLPFLGARWDDPYFSEWKRIEAIREVAESLRYVGSEYPSDLSAICTGAPRYGQLCDTEGEVPVRDRWGNEIWYEPSATQYRIGSAGPDGERGTPDDLEIDTTVERKRISGLAGCYLVEPLDAHDHDERLLMLDTARIDFLSSERKAWAPSPEPFPQPKWHPWRHDSIVVTWARVQEVVDLRLVPEADTLHGVVHSPTGFRTWWDHAVPFSIIALRIDCDAARR